jgi:hypothetical protein
MYYGLAPEACCRIDRPMTVFTRLVQRLLPALLMASSVTLLTAGVFNWAPPQTLGGTLPATPTLDPGNPAFQTLPPTSTPSASPTATSTGPTTSPTAVATPTPTPVVYALPTRLVVPALGIDLAVIEGDSEYPLCNVAQYLNGFALPGQPGTTYLYGHAREGMLLPLLEESEVNDGAGMIGALVNLYTADSKLHVYEINIVKRHALDLTLAYDVGPDEHRLIMQTSEGPHGTVPKLQVAARPIGVYASTPAEALPTAQPKDCSP